MTYTSGTTGVPKAVAVTHRNVASLVGSLHADLPAGPGQVWSQWHSLVFDVSVWEIWGALLHGGRLVVVPEAVASSPEDFHDLLVTEKVSVLCQTPSAVGMLSPEQLESTTLVVAGEACPAELVDRWAPGRVMINAYGPTEATIYAAISAPLTPGKVWCRSVRRCRGRRCSCWISGCGRCRRGWSVSCIWLAVEWASGMCDRLGVDGVAVCGVSVRCAGGADVSHRGCGAVGR